MGRILRLTGYRREPRELAYAADIGGRSFTSRFRFDSLDLEELEYRHGRELLRSLYFHAIAFDLVRLVSLKPDAVDFGPLAECVTTEFMELWQRIFDGVWAQWRYENGLPGWPGPELAAGKGGPRPAPAACPAGGGARSLLFCGGGKDSLLAAKLFEEIDEPYESFAYSHSLYGDSTAQHRLIDGLLDHCRPRRRHRLDIHDDLQPQRLDLEGFGVRTVTAAETPSSLFLALPLALGHGLPNLVLAHERSADSGNLVWDATGEEINHQWGKSLAAETLLAAYVERHLLADVRYFSVLKPVADAVIFPALGDHLEAIPATHSCNGAKPWCRRCPKCVYVFLGYAAWLPREVVLETFGENLFEVAENRTWLQRLLGLEAHLPFECVGQIEESRLFLALAARRGWSGAAIDGLAGTVDAAAVDRLYRVAAAAHRMPDEIARRVIPALRRRAREARVGLEGR